MVTILLSAAGAAIGSGFGGTVLGLSGAVIGRAVGATLGRVIDQRLLGAGSEPVDIGRVDRFRLTGASEGAAVGQIWGRVRIAGQVIWATEFLETVTRSGGGKGTPQPRTNSYAYSVSLAIALCEGEILRVGRIWADGIEIPRDRLNLRVYTGSETQRPDPKIEAVEGAGRAPAYRGTAYVVIEDLELSAYGNRVPQFNFEVFRRAQGDLADATTDLSRAVRGVAMIPGTGEYSLATTRVHFADGLGGNRSANVNSASGQPDLVTSLDQLGEELPACGSVSLVVSWFGSDLRCGQCEVQPKVEQTVEDGEGMPWVVSGTARAGAGVVPVLEGRPVYGGTPADQSVIEAIRAIRDSGKEVMFYPFILMEQMAGNGRPDPWSGAENQPVLPWRGRITLTEAPGRPGSPDRTLAAEGQVAAFFGTAMPGHFTQANGAVAYSGPEEWRYRRFILHYAHLCALAGGVDAFCIGSEMVALTQIRGAEDSFPAVAALKQLAGEVRAILGPGTKISYAADWSEYFGYHRDGNVYFHLDPLWSDPDIDFIGIDNYMPLSDWRDGEEHADSSFGSIYNPAYLMANVAGGEGYDWYYDGPEGEAAQRRLPITDGAHDEPWVFRYKDLKGWWSNAHHDRIDGQRKPAPTGWIPQSKPIRFTEYGCAAIDKGTNQPNKFLDPKSSESVLPKHSNGRRDDLIQMQYVLAMADYWGQVAHNPVSAIYGARMVDMARAHLWAWDARPFPDFPANTTLWSDGENYARGHWLNGRATNQTLAAVVAEICERSGVEGIDVSALYGLVRGYQQGDLGSARAALQPLMLVYGFDAVERGGLLQFRMRDGQLDDTVSPAALAVSTEIDGTIERLRAPEVETAGQVRLGYVEAEGSYETRLAEASYPDPGLNGVSQSDIALVMTASEGRAVTERWIAEARVARDGARFALPPSALALGAGDVVELEGARYRIDRVELAEAQLVDAMRVERGLYVPSDAVEERVVPRTVIPPVPVLPVFLDLPLLSGSETPHAPHVAVAARPWPGAVAVWSSQSEEDFDLNRLLPAAAVIGRTESALRAAPAGLWDRGEPLRVRISGGALASASEAAVLNGANVMAIGDGSAGRWELFQFRTADLVAPRTYDLGLRLRGQAGTDGVMPTVWPVGSRVVLVNRAVQQLELPLAARGLSRFYRVGAAGRGYDDPAVVTRTLAFDGIGLRPFPVAHLALRPGANGALVASWIRRTRIDGDTWQAREVPLGEQAELYLVRVIADGTIVREVEVGSPTWTYSAAAQQTDGPAADLRIAVAQVSEQFGAGPFRQISVA